jgi:hypothetical protein
MDLVLGLDFALDFDCMYYCHLGTVADKPHQEIVSKDLGAPGAWPGLMMMMMI